MGTWGSGILQNDTTQDGLVEIASGIEADISDEDLSWEEFVAAVGLLVQFSPYSLEPENEFRTALASAIARHRPQMTDLGDALNALLESLENSRVPTYTMRTFPKALEHALHGTGSEFPMQKTWALAPEDCFARPGSQAYLQALAAEWAATIEEDFADEDAIEDLCRESFCMGQLALLLIVEPLVVDLAMFERWRGILRAGRSQHGDESEFYDRYYASVEAAFDYAASRFGHAATIH